MKKNENVDVEEKEKTPKQSTETKSKRSTTNEKIGRASWRERVCQYV